MSRVGKKPVDIPAKVKVEIKGSIIYVEGPKGTLEHKIPDGLKVSQKDTKIIVEKTTPAKEIIPLYGLTRTVIFNLIKGVADGYSKELEIKGVGFKAQMQGKNLKMALGFSHPVLYEVPEGITVATPKPVRIIISGIDKVKVGEVAAEIRDFFRAEPYTGKGIMHVGERVRRKAGKTVTK
ncbi:MAG: 50S ribosomal protein L6 [Candidatus Omnitrophica bacterium]|nr:50S ribosomal protein L6 [Candidatus Omnitrophota bacterium]